MNRIIAVYGTLKKWYLNYERLTSKAEFIWEDFVKCFWIRSWWFPICSFKSENWISIKPFFLQVELYKVDEQLLTAIDSLEWHPNWYKRTPVSTLGWKEVEIYHMHWVDSTFLDDVIDFVSKDKDISSDINNRYIDYSDKFVKSEWNKLLSEHWFRLKCITEDLDLCAKYLCSRPYITKIDDNKYSWWTKYIKVI